MFGLKKVFPISAYKIPRRYYLMLVVALLCLVGFKCYTSANLNALNNGQKFNAMVNAQYGATLTRMNIDLLSFVDSSKNYSKNIENINIVPGRFYHLWHRRALSLSRVSVADLKHSTQPGFRINRDFLGVSLKSHGGEWHVMVSDDLVEGGQMSSDDVQIAITYLMDKYLAHLDYLYETKKGEARRVQSWL